MDISKQIGINLKKARESKGISQETLASLADLDRTYIFSIEKGRRNISVSVLFKISRALELSIHEILKDIENEL